MSNFAARASSDPVCVCVCICMCVAASRVQTVHGESCSNSIRHLSLPHAHAHTHIPIHMWSVLADCCAYLFAFSLRQTLDSYVHLRNQKREPCTVYRVPRVHNNNTITTIANHMWNTIYAPISFQIRNLCFQLYHTQCKSVSRTVSQIQLKRNWNKLKQSIEVH